MLLAESRPGERATFLLPRKVGQRGAPAAAPSGNLCRGICGVCRITHCALRAPFKQTRHVRSRSADTLRCQRHPANTTPQARAKRGEPDSQTSTRAIAALAPLSRPNTVGYSQRSKETRSALRPFAKSYVNRAVHQHPQNGATGQDPSTVCPSSPLRQW